MTRAAVWYLTLLLKKYNNPKILFYFQSFYIKYRMTRAAIWYLKKLGIILNIVWRVWPFNI